MGMRAFTTNEGYKIIAVSYGRTSGESGDSVSISSQHKRNRTYAESVGAFVAYEFDEEYTGTKIERPCMNDIRKLIVQGKINAIVVFSADRLARSEYASGYLLDEVFIPHGIRLFLSSGAKEVDPSNPDSRLMFGVESTFSAHEARKIKERTARGKRELLEEGIWVGEGKTNKYGYRREGHKRNTVIVCVDEEIALVQRIYTMFYSEDMGVQRICETLTAQGIATPSSAKGMLWNTRSTWHKSMIYRILKEEAYTGKWAAKRWKRIPNDNGGYKNIPLPKEEWVYIHMPHTRIVSDALFEAVAVKLSEGRSTNAPRPRNEYLLGRCCKCQECGYAMFSKRQGKWGETHYSYYNCGGKEEKRSPCTLPASSTQKVDALVWAELEIFLKDPNYRRATLEAAQDHHTLQHKDALDMVQSADRVKSRFQDELYRLTELYTDGSIPKSIFLRKKADLDEKLAGADAILAEYQAVLGADFLSDTDLEGVDSGMRRLGEELDKLGALTYERKRALVEAMGVTATFQREQYPDGYTYLTVRIFVYGTTIGDVTIGEVKPLSACSLHNTRKILIAVLTLHSCNAPTRPSTPQ